MNTELIIKFICVFHEKNRNHSSLLQNKNKHIIYHEYTLIVVRKE